MTKRRRIVLCAIIGAVLVLLAVKWWPVSRSQLVGTYRCSYPYGNEILTLNTDGTYVQVLPAQGPQLLTNRGVWSYKGNELTLADAIVIDDAFGSRRTDLARTLWTLRMTRSLGGSVRIIVNEDLEFEFVRQK